MSAGYSANPLFRKLGLKEGFHVKLIHAPASYPQLIPEIYNQLILHEGTWEKLDFIHFFPETINELEQILPRLKAEIKKNGMIWISWYKNSSGKKTELSENCIRDTALATGLVDIKVCAIDADWSGLKLVFRMRDR
ncbi:MAG TPA: DUF3052 family protein [Puia sp.]